MNEAEFMRSVTELAESWLHWRYAHFRPARTQQGWRTPVSGSLGKGFPDLLMVRGERIIAAELKSEKGKTSPEQTDVLAVLAAAGIETYVWRPSDWEAIVKTLT